MKLSLMMVLAALSLSLLACEEKKDDAAKPGTSAAPATTAKATTPASSAAPGGW